MKFLSLFSGIGGLDLGLERSGMTCIGQVEIDPWCRAVLEKHWTTVPKWEDIRTFTGEDIGAVDLVAGGFPCQPVSVAGLGLAQADDRWLWPEMLRVIKQTGPRWVLAENVPGLRNRGADIVLGDLEESGYSATAIVVGAEHVGAPHKRHRVWIVAYSARNGQPNFTAEKWADYQWEHPRLIDFTAMADAECGEGIERYYTQMQRGRAAEAEQTGMGGSDGWPSGPGQPQYQWEHPRLIDFTAMGDATVSGFGSRGGLRPDGEPSGRRQSSRGCDGDGTTERRVGFATDGVSARLLRLARWHNRQTLRAAGNSVVPQIVEMIGRRIMAMEFESIARRDGK